MKRNNHSTLRCSMVIIAIGLTLSSFMSCNDDGGSSPDPTATPTPVQSTATPTVSMTATATPTMTATATPTTTATATRTPDPAIITFTGTYGGSRQEFGSSVQQTTDGGYIACGTTYSFGAGLSDAYLVKTDDRGTASWSKTFGGALEDYAASVRQTTDGGYILVGLTRSFGAGGNDILIMKTNTAGHEQWSCTFGGANDDRGNSVRQTSDGGYIICGSTGSFGVQTEKIVLLRIDASGTTMWYGIYGEDKHASGRSVRQTTDGGFIICGTASSSEQDETDVFLVRTDGNGYELWSRTLGGTRRDYGYAVQQTTDGGFIVCGYTISRIYNANVLLIKTDDDGNQQWVRTYANQSHRSDIGSAVQQTTDGGFIICGSADLGSSEEDGATAYLIRTDSLGKVLWSQKFGEYRGLYMGHFVEQTTDGGYILVGNASSPSIPYDLYLVKTDPWGNVW